MKKKSSGGGSFCQLLSTMSTNRWRLGLRSRTWQLITLPEPIGPEPIHGALSELNHMEWEGERGVL